jgi:hypothetical protein
MPVLTASPTGSFQVHLLIERISEASPTVIAKLIDRLE